MPRKLSLVFPLGLILFALVIDPTAAYSQERIKKQTQEIREIKKINPQLIQPPQVDLTCQIDVENAGVMQFRYKIRVKNKGTKTLNDVMFNWLITKQGTMVDQDGAGFSLMYPDTWYETTRGLFTKPPENYSIQIFLDPDNAQGEPAALRGDNTCTR